MEVLYGFVEARGWGREAQEGSSSEEFGFGHEAGGSPSWLIDKVVLRVDVVLPERGQALQDVMCEWVRLGVEEGSPFVGDWRCGRGEGLGDLAAALDGWSAGREEVTRDEYGGSAAHD